MLAAHHPTLVVPMQPMGERGRARSTGRIGLRYRRQSLQHIGQPGEVGDAQRLAAQRRGDAGGGQQGFGLGRQRLQALAQHLAALAEGGGRDGAQRLDRAGGRRGRSMGANSTIAEETVGGGVKASGFTVKSSRGRVRHWAITASRP